MIGSVEVVGYGRDAGVALAASVYRAKARGPLAPVTVIVPSNFAGLAARRLLGSGLVGPNGGGATGIANVNFVTPFRLAELVAADRLGDLRPLTNPVLGAAVRLALAEVPGPFAPVADHAATEAAVAAVHTELHGLSPAALDAIALECGPIVGSLLRLHRAVRAHLRGFAAEADVARAAAGRHDLASVVAPMGHVVWYLPEPCGAPLAELVGAVLSSAVSSDVIVGSTGEALADQGVWSVCDQAGLRVGSRAGAAVPAVPSADLIVSVTDPDEEVRAVVRRIAALAEQGVPLDRVGVCFPTPDPYTALLAQQLAAAAIPANGPVRRRLADSVAGRTLLGALRLPSERWRRDRVMALVSGGPIRHDGGFAHPVAWETCSRQAGVVQDLVDWRLKLDRRAVQLRARLAARPGTDPTEVDTAVAHLLALGSFVERLARSVAAVGDGDGWPAKAAAARDLLVDLLGGEHLHRRWPEYERDAFDRVVDALSRLATLGELEPYPSDDVFVRALTAELDVVHGRAGRFGQGVWYGPLAAAIGLDLDAVFVLGCAEGRCPAPRRDDAMLPDAVRFLADGELELRSARLDHQHRQFLAALAAAPPGRRVLTFPRGDLRSGRTALPSRWLLDSASALVGSTVHATDFDVLGPPVVDVVRSHASGLLDPPAFASVEDRDAGVLFAHTSSGAPVDGHPVATLVGRGLGAQAARRSDRFTEWDGNLAGQPVPSALDRPQSPTSLERWAGCGFRYFLSDVLGLDQRVEPERILELDPLGRGELVHEVLERFLGSVIDAGAPGPDEPWTDDDRRAVMEIADEVFARYEAEGRTGRAVRWKLTRDELAVLIESFLADDERFRATTRSRPVAVEMAFGTPGAVPVTLSLPDGRELSFRGRADRVDRGDDGVVLVSDYKTGRASSFAALAGADADPVQGGTRLQLGLYVEAALAAHGGTGADVGYWMLSGGGDRIGYRWSAERRARMLEVLDAIVGGIEGGMFAAVPGEWDTWRRTYANCTFCPFDTVCPGDRGEHAAAIAGAPELGRRDALAWEGPS